MKLKLSALTLAMLPALAMAAPQGKAPAKAYADDSLIVVYKKDASLQDRQQVRAAVNGHSTSLNSKGIDTKFSHILDGRMSLLELDAIKAGDALKLLSDHPAVEYVELNYIVSINALPSDPRFGDLWGLHNTGQNGGTPGVDISAEEAWGITTGDSNVVVGVIDTGIDHSHPDLNANMWVNTAEIAGNNIDDDNNGFVDDIYGINAITNTGDPMDDHDHGTHVAGTIGAVHNNGEGVAGVAAEVSLAGCKFLAADGFGDSADAITCVNYFIDQKQKGVNIVALNNSWGGGSPTQAMEDAITAAGDNDILFLAAAGNSGADNDASPHYPSSYVHDNILAVASTTRTDGSSGYSYGLTSVDMGAPGTAILSTVVGGGYASFSGTSMATPHVAGAAAILAAQYPDMTAVEIKNVLMNSGDDNDWLNGRTVSGKRLNMYQALMDADPTPRFTMDVSPGRQEIVAGGSAEYNFTMGSVSDWQGEISLTLDSSLAGATLSTNTVNEDGSFTLTVPTTSDTDWGDYDFTVTGASGDLSASQSVSLTVMPQGLEDYEYSNVTPVDIPDNDAGGVNSVINVPDTLTTFGISVHVDITHTWIGDILIKLTSPTGTEKVVRARSGGSQDDINETYEVADFNGEAAMGDWTLNVSDHVGQDTGTLNNWSLTVTGLGEAVEPQAPEAGFSATPANLDVSFTDTSSDANNDIVSWAWDFGDGMSSGEQHPMHSYAAAGTYTVTLTVTDSEGMSDSHSMDVTVEESQFDLSVSKSFKSRMGRLRVDLSWGGSGSGEVDIYRNGVKIATADNNGLYRDRERRIEGDSFTYKVCQGENCSNEVTVNF